MYKESRQKTRNQSLFEYLEALQIEFIQAEIRLKIYSKSKDKRFWKKVLSHKEAKIKDIADRNSLMSILNDKSIRDRYRDRIVNQTGIPSFIYRDDEDRDEFLIKDFTYYFKEESEVRVLIGNGNVSIGVIKESPEMGLDIVGIKLKGSSEISYHSIVYVTRIL